MKISFNWLKQYIDIQETAEEIAEILTATGLEVEKVEHFSTGNKALDALVIGEVIECVQHPNADKLKLTQVDIGEGELSQIVCGAPNVAKGQKVVVAPVNSTIHPTEGEPFKIKKAKIRGEVSYGMICAEDEIGLGSDHSGIMVLDTSLENGTTFTEYLDVYEDVVFEIGLTPNRGDGTSHIGVARDLKAALDRPIKLPSVNDFSQDEMGEGPEIIIENTEACPRYTGISLANVEVKESPQWLKNYLLSIGINSINNIVDITNYVLHETGQPLHAFDADAITGDKVIVKTLPSKTTFVTLDEEKRELTDTDLMICNAEEGMCIAGVFGGIASGVKESTQRIFLESAYFSPAYIRRTSQHHSLKTDAAFRYERGCDPEITVYALKRAVGLMKEWAGAKVISPIMDVYPKPLPPFEIQVKYKNVDRLIGKSIERETIGKILNNLDIELKQVTEDGFLAIVPQYRSDVTREADIIEEILRIYGFNNVELPESVGSDYMAHFPAVDRSSIVKGLTAVLTGRGFFETMTNSLTKPEYVELTTAYDSENNVDIVNKLSEDLAVMRQTMLFHLAEVAAYNQRHRQKTIKFFEAGKVYRKSGKGYKEDHILGVLIGGDYVPKWWNNEGGKSDFYHLSDTVHALISRVSSKEITTQPSNSDEFDYSLDFQCEGKPVARAGKISQKISKVLNLKGDIYFAEVYLDNLLKKHSEGISYTEVAKFPEVKRDLSLVIDKNISYNKIREVAEKNTNHLLKRMDLFDVYEGDKIDAGKKAYAVSFLLQDQKQTLADKQIDKTMTRLMGAYKRELDAIIRE